MIESYSNPRKTREVLWFALEKNNLGLGFSVDVVRVRVGLACFWFFFFDVRDQTMSRICGSKFGWILGWNMNLYSPRSTS